MTISVEQAMTNYDAAYAVYQNVQAELATARTAIAANAPAAALSAGVSLTTAAAALATAQNQLGFLTEAQDAALIGVQAAQATINQANLQATWGAPLQAAITARLAAIQAHETAVATAAQALQNYIAATQVIASAYSAVIPQPNFLRENPLQLPQVPNWPPFVQQMRAYAEEVRLWGVSQ
jgi:hypothetical protein